MSKPLIPGGYILLSRQILESGIMEKPPLYFKVWTWLLLKAQHRDYGNLKRGQLFTSIPEIQEAMAYKVGFRTEKPSYKEVWGVIDWLRKSPNTDETRFPDEGDNEGMMKGNMIRTMKVTHGMIVTIVNYSLYQSPKNYEGNSEGNYEGTMKEERKEELGNNINKNDKNVKNEKNDKNKTSLEISNFRLRYSDSELKIIDEYFDILRWTRKSGKIADSIIIGQYKYWEKYSIPKVIYGLKTYIGNPKHHDKRENYTNAIIRNATAEQVADKKETKPKRVIVDQNPFLNRR